MSRTVELLHKIDKTSSATAIKVNALDARVDRHITREDNWQDRMEEAVKECPEAGHIKEQNGKINKIMIFQKALALIAAAILILGAIATMIFGYMGNASGDPSIVPYSYACPEDRVVAIGEVLTRLNNSNGAMELNIQFACDNRGDSYPVLIMNMRVSCLNCDSCKSMLSYYRNNWSQISSGWYMWFGSKLIDVYNSEGKLMYKVDENGKIIQMKHALNEQDREGVIYG